jgi:hypothetical protein
MTPNTARCFERGLALVQDSLRREPDHTMLRYSARSLHGSSANLGASPGRRAEAVADRDQVVALDDVPAYRIVLRASLYEMTELRR